MTRKEIERHQVWLYLAAILLGLVAGSFWPALAPTFEMLVWPSLAVLLYATFTQVPLARLPAAFGEKRFLAANLVGNFVFVPLIVLGLIQLLPDEPAVVLGVAMVLLVPCTDWFNTFAHLGGGSARLALVATPVNLLAQIALLPVYLWLFFGQTFAEAIDVTRFALVFAALIVVPLLLAMATQHRRARRTTPKQPVERTAWLPVPALAVVVFLVAGSQVHVVADAGDLLASVAGIYAAYLVAAAALGLVVAKAFHLDTAAARTLVFSLGTRNSFVVLPFALALPASWEAAAVVVVLQSLVELFGMLGYLRWVPRRLIPRPPTL